MIKKIASELWKPLVFKSQKSMRNKYAISSLGHITSYKNDLHEDGKMLKGSFTSGYKTLNLHVNGKSQTIYFHRQVAELFNRKNSSKEKIVIHLNHDKTDNRSKNLKWVSQEESIAHQQKSPARKAYREVQQNRTKGPKLNTTKVKAIKTLLANPKRKLTNRQVAEKYNVSEMTIYRILRGESWANVS